MLLSRLVSSRSQFSNMQKVYHGVLWDQPSGEESKQQQGCYAFPKRALFDPTYLTLYSPLEQSWVGARSKDFISLTSTSHWILTALRRGSDHGQGDSLVRGNFWRGLTPEDCHFWKLEQQKTLQSWRRVGGVTSQYLLYTILNNFVSL